MSAKSKLREALNSIENAIRSLQRARNNSQDNSDINRAIRELQDAEDEIRRAISQIPEQY